MIVFKPNDRWHIVFTDIKKHWIDFEVIPVMGEEVSGDTIYGDLEDMVTGNPIEVKPEYKITGNIKWDGCSNWSFLDGSCMMHFCSTNDIKELNEAMLMVYSEAHKIFGDNGVFQ